MRIVYFLLSRAAQLIGIALLLTFAMFLLSSIIPGDFFSLHLADSSVRAETVEQLRHEYGLDQPAYIQYLQWLKRLMRLDLGHSLFYQRPVSQVVIEAFFRTLWIGIPALILGFGIGILLGAFRGVFVNHPLGRILDLFSTIALSMPSLLLGMMALLFAARTGWFPLGSMNSVESLDAGLWQWLADRLHHLVLPVVCLSIPILAYVERIQFAATQSGAHHAAARAGRARGLSPIRIFFQYIVHPGLNPVISISGPMLGAILSGSLVLEVIFSWPGLGQITYDALFNSDHFLLAGCILGCGILLVAGSLLADIALMVLDPRTRALAGRVSL